MLRRTLLAVSAAFSAGAAFAADKVGIRPEPSSIIYTSLCLQTDLVLKIPKHLPIFPPLSSFLIRNVLGAHVFGMQRCRSPTRLTLSGIWSPF